MGRRPPKTFGNRETVRHALGGLLPVLLLGTLLAGCLTDDPVPPPAERALAYLEEQDLQGALAIQALQATAGRVDPAHWPPGAPLLERIQVPDRYGDLLRLADGLLLHGLDPTDFRGTDLIARILDGHDGGQFGASPSLVDDAWAVDVLARTEHRDDERVQAGVQRLHDTQAGDGGWRWDGGDPGDTDVTAWVLEALAQAGALEAVRAEARAFLDDGRGPDGAYSSLGVGPNCQSTALALLAHDALGAPRPTASATYLLACQGPDGGFAHAPGDDASSLWATLDVLPVLPGRAGPAAA